MDAVTRLRRTQIGSDTANRPLYEWTPTPLPVPCQFDPGGSLEPAEVGRAHVITTPKAYFRGEVDVAAADRLRIRGRDYAVVGDPAVWGNPTVGTVVELQASTEEG